MRRLPSTGLCYLVLTRGNLAIKHEIAFTLRHSWQLRRRIRNRARRPRRRRGRRRKIE